MGGGRWEVIGGRWVAAPSRTAPTGISPKKAAGNANRTESNRNTYANKLMNKPTSTASCFCGLRPRFRAKTTFERTKTTSNLGCALPRIETTQIQVFLTL